MHHTLLPSYQAFPFPFVVHDVGLTSGYVLLHHVHSTAGKFTSIVNNSLTGRQQIEGRGDQECL